MRKAKARQDLGWALKRLKRGEKVVRLDWVKDRCHIFISRLDADTEAIMFEDRNGGVQFWMPDTEDMLANDYALWHVSMFKAKRKKMTRVTSS